MWQELRSNFILCLVKKESTNKVSNGVFRHPVFSSGVRSLGVRQWLRLVRLGFVGGEFQSRTHQHNLRLTSQQVREVKRGQAMSKSGGEILLPQIPPRLGAGLVTTSPRITPSFSWAPRKDGVLNPLYHHLIDPLIFRERWLSELGEDFPSLSEQLVRWETHSRPLENKNCPFGLTPLGTYRFAPELMLLARRDILENEVSSFSDLSLLHEGEKIDQLRKRLGNFEKKKFTPAEWRELWCLLDGAQNIELDR
jgi:hypothetical protein